MVALPLLVLLGAGLRAFLGTDDPHQRYATMPVVTRVLLKDRGPIDLLVVGTSRSMYAIDETVIAAQARNEDGSAPVIEDLSHRGRAYEQIYRMLQDLFARRRVQAVLYEISRREDRVHYYHYYPNFSITNTFRDLLADFASKPREPRLSRLRDLLELFIFRVDKSLALLLKDRNRHSWGRPPVKRLLRKMDVVGPVLETPAGREKWRKAVEAAYGSWDKAPAARWSLDDINEDRASYYLPKTIALCRDHGVTPVFFHVPGYLEAPPSEDTKREFRERYGFPLLTPPAEVLTALYIETNFRDINHLKEEAGAIYSAWLARALRAELRRRPQ